MSKVFVQIVTWNSVNYIAECLDSLADQTFTDFSVLVVDNGSNDKTVSLVRNNFPTASVLENFKNAGYAKANNQGFRLAKNSEYILVLNPDVALEPDFIEELVKVADEHKEAGSYSPKVMKMHSKMLDDHNDESGMREMIKSELIDSTGLLIYKSRRAVNRGEGEVDEGQYERPGEVFGASGAAVLYRKSALDEVSINYEVFDQDFHSYKEDVDLAWRLRLYGWQCWYAPSAVCYHHRGYAMAGKEMRQVIKHRKQVSRFLRALSFRNHKLLLVKNEQWTNVLLGLPWLGSRELGGLLYAIFIEPFQLKTLGQFIKLLPKTLVKRKVIMRHTKVPPAEIRKWFV